MKSITDDPNIQNLRRRNEALQREQTENDRAVEAAEKKLSAAQAHFDATETDELVGAAKLRDVRHAEAAVDTAKAALSEAKAKADNNRRLLAKLTGQRGMIEDRARAKALPAIQKQLIAAIADHAQKMKAAADSQRALDDLRESVYESFGSGTDYSGGTRLRGWPVNPSTHSPALLPLTGKLQRLPKEIDRFLDAARAEGVRI